MKFIIFSLLVSFCLCSEQHVFRYENGTFTKGNESPITIHGSLYYQEYSGEIEVRFLGMDYSTMTPIILLLDAKDATTTGFEIELDCVAAEHGLENLEFLSGTGVLTGSWDKSEFEAECYTRTGDPWIFKSSNVESETFFYPQEEAGFRAKSLIAQPISKYRPANTILFAIYDYPYFDWECSTFLSYSFPHADEPEPGAIMVGKDGGHCAILDNEGTNFIHSNPEAGKVTCDSIEVAEKYFPNGVFYKRYPNDQNYNLKFPFTKLAKRY